MNCHENPVIYLWLYFGRSSVIAKLSTDKSFKGNIFTWKSSKGLKGLLPFRIEHTEEPSIIPHNKLHWKPRRAENTVPHEAFSNCLSHKFSLYICHWDKWDEFWKSNGESLSQSRLPHWSRWDCSDYQINDMIIKLILSLRFCICIFRSAFKSYS